MIQPTLHEYTLILAERDNLKKEALRRIEMHDELVRVLNELADRTNHIKRMTGFGFLSDFLAGGTQDALSEAYAALKKAGVTP